MALAWDALLQELDEIARDLEDADEARDRRTEIWRELRMAGCPERLLAERSHVGLWAVRQSLYRKFGTTAPAS